MSISAQRAFHLLTAVAILSVVDVPRMAPAGDFGSLVLGPCHPVSAPACMMDKETFNAPSKLAACDKQVDSFIKDLSAYRTCMLTVSQQAVSAANDMLFSYRCSEGRKTECMR